jgi:photosystem II stability/assembly factor-like uncharacterized protein
MPRTLLLVGTRKGCFLLESDESRRDWTLRGPFCESWPIFHAIHDEDSGAIYAAAASEWFGTSIWRSPDLGETWTQSSEGLSYGENGARKLTKVSNLTAAHGRLLAGADQIGIFESTDDGQTWSLYSEIEGVPTREGWDERDVRPPGDLGVAATVPASDPQHLWAVVQGIGVFETTDDGKTWTPRNEGLRADWPLEDPAVGYCVHKLVRSPVDGDRFYQQNHVGMHRSDDGARTWTEITEGLPTEFGFAAATHPHDRETFWVVPLDPGHGRTMPDGKAAVWRTRDAGSSWQRLANGLPQEGAYVGVLREGMAIDSYDEAGLYFGTSTGQLFASTDEGETWSEIESYLPPITSVEVAVVD